MPTINRNFQDLVRLVPQAKVTGDGVMSLAGQNNRFNAFFIDGANNNDIQGISVNGMNGGQTGSPPISIEAIEELNVSACTLRCSIWQLYRGKHQCHYTVR